MPNRIIKESICTSENLDNLKPEEEVFFYRLMVNCDDYGRTDARPQILRAKCFPMKMDKITNNDIKNWLYALVREKLIVIYLVDGKQYLQFVTWGRHQQIRAKKSKYPAPSGNYLNMKSPDINCNQMSAYVPVIGGGIQSGSESYSEAEAESNRDENQFSADAAQNIVNVFESDFGRELSVSEKEQLFQWQSKFMPDVIREALRRAVLKGKFNMRYIDKILFSWEKSNCRTLREVMEYEQAYERAKHGYTDEPVEDPAKVARLEQKRREETIRAACDYITLQCGPDPPRDQVEEIARGYGEEYVTAILEKVYGGRSP